MGKLSSCWIGAVALTSIATASPSCAQATDAQNISSPEKLDVGEIKQALLYYRAHFSDDLSRDIAENFDVEIRGPRQVILWSDNDTTGIYKDEKNYSGRYGLMLLQYDIDRVLAAYRMREIRFAQTIIPKI